jgi:hypothetical protein
VLLVWDRHGAQERAVTGIPFEIPHQQIAFDEIQARIFLPEGAIEPSERLVRLAAAGDSRRPPFDVPYEALHVERGL